MFFEFAGPLLISTLAGAIAIQLRQPLIIAFITVGILSGPAALGWVTAHDQIDLLAQLGVTLLLFAAGLRLDLHLIKNLGAVALSTGIGQILFTTLFGYLIEAALGMAPLTALYVAIALTFSSTIIIVKLLSDKCELESLHGRIAVVRPKMKILSRPTSSIISILAPSSVSMVRAPFNASFMLPVPETSVPA